MNPDSSTTAGRHAGEATGPAGPAGAARGPARIDVPGASVLRIERPGEIAELAACLADHHAKNEGLLVCGGRTRLAFANRARPLAAALSLDALAGVDVFEPDEGVVHALAGTPIRLLQQTVAAEGWELPLDPPGAATTVGGTIASAAMGPRAQVFGRVADAVLGLEVVGADGTPSKCGGRVVKNVTGYDLAKLYTGSFGSLGVVTGAWLRLRPQPARRAVFTSRLARDPASFERARSRARTASLRAFVWNESPGESEAELLIELGSSEAGVRHDREGLGRYLALEPAASDAVDRLRDARAQAASDHPIGLRARVLGTRLDAMRQALLAAGFEVSIDLGLGILTARGGEAPIDARGLERLRAQAVAGGGHASFEWLPTAGFESLDVFGEAPGTRALAAALKARFDPRQILNPGRFVAGT
jgi:glycolate oxidase FAD binding subunit